MKKKAKLTVTKKPLGYQGYRDDTGRTPRQRLDAARAESVEFENRRKREHWQTREEAEAAASETASIVQSDIYGTLPLELAGKLSGRIFTPAEVRLVVRASVDMMVRGWIAGERVPKSSIPKDMEKSRKAFLKAG